MLIRTLEGRAGGGSLPRFGTQTGKARGKNERDRKRACYLGLYPSVIAGAAYLGHVVARENIANLVVYFVLNEFINYE